MAMCEQMPQQILEKNTFLTAEVPRAPELWRARTAPVRVGDACPVDLCDLELPEPAGMLRVTTMDEWEAEAPLGAPLSAAPRPLVGVPVYMLQMVPVCRQPPAWPPPAEEWAPSQDGSDSVDEPPVDEEAGESLAPFGPQVGLTCDFGVDSGKYNVRWTVDARTLHGSRKQAVSPSFNLSCGGSMPAAFRIMLHSKSVSCTKGGCSFRKARGWGSVQLKCEAEVLSGPAPVSFRVQIGDQPARGPVCHDFAQSAVASFPKGQEQWDFRCGVEDGATSFLVLLEVTPVGPVQRA